MLLDDLHSAGFESPADYNLPRVIVAEEGCSEREAVRRTIEIHIDVTAAGTLDARGLRRLHELKTGRLPAAGVEAVLSLHGARGPQAAALRRFAAELGCGALGAGAAGGRGAGGGRGRGAPAAPAGGRRQ